MGFTIVQLIVDVHETEIGKFVHQRPAKKRWRFRGVERQRAAHRRVEREKFTTSTDAAGAACSQAIPGKVFFPAFPKRQETFRLRVENAPRSCLGRPGIPVQFDVKLVVGNFRARSSEGPGIHDSVVNPGVQPRCIRCNLPDGIRTILGSNVPWCRAVGKSPVPLVLERMDRPGKTKSAFQAGWRAVHGQKRNV